MRKSPSSYGNPWGTAVRRNPWDVTAQSNTISGLGDATDVPPPTAEPLGELTALGWVGLGAGIGWAASAYSNASLAGTEQITAAWGGACAGAALLGVRRLINGDSQGIGPLLIGLAGGAAGFFFAQGRSKRSSGWSAG